MFLDTATLLQLQVCVIILKRNHLTSCFLFKQTTLRAAGSLSIPWMYQILFFLHVPASIFNTMHASFLVNHVFGWRSWIHRQKQILWYDRIFEKRWFKPDWATIKLQHPIHPSLLYNIKLTSTLKSLMKSHLRMNLVNLTLSWQESQVLELTK